MIEPSVSTPSTSDKINSMGWQRWARVMGAGFGYRNQTSENAEFGNAEFGITSRAPKFQIPHSAFRIPHSLSSR
jgi:hypothetical protein